MESEEQPIRLRAVMQLIGKPKEHVEKKIRDYIDEIKENKTLMIFGEKISEAEKQGEVYGIVAEIEVVVKGLPNLVGFCIDYMPASIDIIKPDKFDFPQRTFNTFINDMLTKLYNVDMIAKRLGTENTILKKNMNSLITNNLAILIKVGINNSENLAKYSGISEAELKKYIEYLIKENKIKEDSGVYSLIQNGQS
jgi:hypothetical protein